MAVALRSSTGPAGLPTAATAAAVNPVAGVVHKGSFTCEARCMCPSGRDSVWVGERSGLLTVRCARTGKVTQTLQPSTSNFLFATCMTTTPHGEMWVGTTDGRVCVFDLNTNDMIVELVSPETEKAGEISCIAVEGKVALVGSGSQRVTQWHLVTKEFMRSFVHPAPVSSLVLKGGVCYAGDANGNVIAWDIHTAERSADYKCDSAVTCVVMEPTTSTLWCALGDGRIAVLSLTPTMRLAELVTGPKGRLNTLMTVGGKVWGAGIEKTTYVWHAASRKLLGKTKDHSAFVFQLTKLYTLETARVWSLSNDKTVQMYDGEGFFSNVALHGSVSEEVTAAQAQAQSLKLQIDLLERKLSLEEEKVTTREVEVEKLKDEVHKQLLKLNALEHIIEQKDDALHGNKSERQRLFEETSKLNAQIADLQGKLNAAEHEKTVLRGDVAKAEEALTRARTEVQEKSSAALVAETERKSVTEQKDKVGDKLKEKDDEIAKLHREMKQMRDELVSKGLEAQRRARECETSQERVKQLEQQVADREGKFRTAEEARRRLDDMLIVRDNELKQLNQQLQNFTVMKQSQSQEVATLTTAKQREEKQAVAAQDNLLLKSHEYEVVSAEREKLEKMLSHEKQQVQDARNNEQRLSMQNDELRRQLEKEKNAVRMLEEQYTIFQFVINSRGELINSIWTLHTKVGLAAKSLRALDSGVSQVDPTKDKLTLKREWKANVVDRTKVSFESVLELQQRVDYIIANYLSEYEKMHLGIPTTKFTPDESRPAIVGDQLLTKLRDVTLMKQVPAPSEAVKAARLPPPTGSTLSVEHFSAAPKPTSSSAAALPRPSSAPAASASTSAPGTGHSVRRI